MDRDRTERLIKVDNETHSSTSRLTVEGKRLTYTLEVIQQPQRARACGAGAKSSADRRPVDPPPIVELKIFDGEVAPENDITFTMNANYFLFATLEQARPIAQGRVPEDKNRLTVLTGTPVAGMVYLDRPSAAGYFIFPDLSVRHEGKYRLSFSLYEELKNSNDFDKMANGSTPAEEEAAHVTHRLEVKSVPFTVFSAKKFPGLAESTSLSRMVAEQGCRVRIRRDVRMRRRDQKPGKDWDDYEEDTAQARSRMSSTPESMHYGSMPGAHGHAEHANRPRSSSNASHQSLPALSRRPSNQELGHAYAQPYGTVPMTPQSSYGQSSSLGPAQRQQYQQPSYVQQSQSMQPPMQPQSAAYAPSSVSNNGSHSAFYGYTPSQQPQMAQYAPHPAYEANVAAAQRSSIDHSTPYQQHDGHAAMHYGQSASYQAPAQQAYQPPPPPPAGRNSFPALTPSFGSHEFSRPQQIQSAALGVEPAIVAAERNHKENVLPPLRIPDAPTGILEASSPAPSVSQSSYFPSTMDSHQKRSYGSVFNDRHLQQRLHDGTRPAVPYSHDTPLNGNQYTAADADDDASDFDPSMMLRKRMDYRRADGSTAARCLPQSL